jgi:hypothetical protein
MTAMVDATSQLRHDLEAVSRGLQAVHKQILDAEGQFMPDLESLALLDRLINDPEWAWLRALSMLIADLDEALAKDTDLTPDEAAACRVSMSDSQSRAASGMSALSVHEPAPRASVDARREPIGCTDRR